jgi:hypothetical protein
VARELASAFFLKLLEAVVTPYKLVGYFLICVFLAVVVMGLLQIFDPTPREPLYAPQGPVRDIPPSRL